MKQNDLDFFKKWFSKYCKTFYSPNPEDQRNISLKEQHTFRVCTNMVDISGRLRLDYEQVLLAETIALFHDIGRFPQYAKYGTFRDDISVNHGLLGAQTLREKGILRSLSANEQEVIIQSVMFHNAFSVPRKKSGDVIFFIKLIRDADKLDIWRVFMDYYESPDEQKASAVGLGLPDAPGYSEPVLSVVYEKRIVSLSEIKTLNDFKLLQLSWIFDLNFKPSYELLSERRYIDKIIAHLPRTGAMRDLSSFLKEFVEAKIFSL